MSFERGHLSNNDISPKWMSFGYERTLISKLFANIHTSRRISFERDGYIVQGKLKGVQGCTRYTYKNIESIQISLEHL